MHDFHYFFIQDLCGVHIHSKHRQVIEVGDGDILFNAKLLLNTVYSRYLD